MNRTEVILRDAKKSSFLRVRGRDTSAIENAYLSWCTEHNMPYLRVRAGYKYASVSLDASTSSFIISDEGVRQLAQLARCSGIRTDNIGYGMLYCSIEHVPNELAESLAIEMLSIYEEEKVLEASM